MNTLKFAKAIAEQPPAPCDGCVKRHKCAEMLLACEDFGAYVLKGWAKKTNRRPTRAIYNQIHADDTDAPIWLCKKQTPDEMIRQAISNRHELARVWT